MDCSDEKKHLRGIKFAPLPPAPNQARPQSRLAHPGGPMKTNKAAALAKFLERKLQGPDGLASVNTKHVELAVKNAKETVKHSGTSTSGRIVHHVKTFGDYEESDGEEKTESSVSTKLKQKKKKKKKNKKNKQKKFEDSVADTPKRPKKKLKL